MTADFVHDPLMGVYVHPETDVMILAEDMPEELRP